VLLGKAIGVSSSCLIMEKWQWQIQQIDSRRPGSRECGKLLDGTLIPERLEYESGKIKVFCTPDVPTAS
jgi:hypothetical protein